LYVWSAPFAFVLVRFRQAVAQTVLAAASLVIVANLRSATLQGQRLSTSVIGVASLVAVGVLVDRLMRLLLAGQGDQQRLAAQLDRSQRLDSLGQLAGGVAHDFNNLLAIVLNYASFVSEGLPATSPVQADIAEIHRAAERGATLTHQLLAFASEEAVEAVVLSLNDTVAEVERLLRRTLGEHVDLRCHLAEALWPVLADQGQLEQVLVNLAVNARDAMPDGGRLTIDTANQDVDEHYAATRPGISPGRWVRLRVSDTGAGMDLVTLKNAFDPFFTTKPKGRGTGLGLATIHGIISQAGGYCQLYSEPGRGTTFTALLPATDQAAQPATESILPSPPGGTETILVAEDEPAIRAVARRILEGHHYRVLEAADGAAALALIRQHGDGIDLLLTDVIMPGLIGKDLVDLFVSIAPSAKVMYMSGYADSVLGPIGNLEPSIQFLEKPFSSNALLTKVRQALDG
jgi:two-component system cell cycle sensor histidine kinase/response regulator CckA